MVCAGLAFFSMVYASVAEAAARILIHDWRRRSHALIWYAGSDIPVELQVSMPVMPDNLKMPWKLIWISRAKPYLAVALAGVSESGNGTHGNYFSSVLNSGVLLSCGNIRKGVSVATSAVGI